MDGVTRWVKLQVSDTPGVGDLARRDRVRGARPVLLALRPPAPDLGPYADRCRRPYAGRGRWPGPSRCPRRTERGREGWPPRWRLTAGSTGRKGARLGMSWEYYSNVASGELGRRLSARHDRTRGGVGVGPQGGRAHPGGGSRAGHRRHLGALSSAKGRSAGPADPELDGGPVDTRVESFGRIGVALTMIGFLLSVGGVVLRGLAAGRLPWGNMFEFTTTRHGARGRRLPGAGLAGGHALARACR